MDPNKNPPFIKPDPYANEGTRYHGEDAVVSLSDFRHRTPAIDQQIADAIIQKLSPAAQEKILNIAKTIGANRKGRRATEAIIRRDVAASRSKMLAGERLKLEKAAKLARDVKRFERTGHFRKDANADYRAAIVAQTPAVYF